MFWSGLIHRFKYGCLKGLKFQKTFKTVSLTNSIDFITFLGKPNPTSWNLPVAKYTNQACDIEKDFREQTIIFNINFCGAWAEGRWIFECLQTRKTCKDYVRETPNAFRGVYWEVNSLKVYEKKGKNRTKGRI